ncbi:unnamed protein product [Mytilus edulis]|uniref:AMP-dependent synthetase/ligase domain-containing protein n=1 Tax=Mytilus edulis TaxID=6550 RepID=A0A8S3PUC0_MYTED|nr:unnamed protein product [Mytilus edulis]
MGTETSYEQQGLLHEMFSKQAKKTPDKIAIVEDSGAKITFKELDESSDKLGKHLVHKGVTINSCVGIYLDKSIAYVTACIAILKAGHKSDSDELIVSVDGAWQKRGSGRSYDSLSGHCSMIGAETGKIIGYSVRSKFCKTCDEANRKGNKAKMHDCRLNWDGSSKAMEQDMNQNDPDGVENGLEAVGRHPFGDHTFCEKTWCSHVEDPSKKYTSLPFGKPLKDIPLQMH